MCDYIQSIKKIPYPRVLWKSNCGFELALMEGYNIDWRSNDYEKLVLPKGKCLKCNQEINIKQ